jgi:hypothetical protein
MLTPNSKFPIEENKARGNEKLQERSMRKRMTRDYCISFLPKNPDRYLKARVRQYIVHALQCFSLDTLPW